MDPGRFIPDGRGGAGAQFNRRAAAIISRQVESLVNGRLIGFFRGAEGCDDCVGAAVLSLLGLLRDGTGEQRVEIRG